METSVFLGSLCLILIVFVLWLSGRNFSLSKENRDLVDRVNSYSELVYKKNATIDSVREQRDCKIKLSNELKDKVEILMGMNEKKSLLMQEYLEEIGDIKQRLTSINDEIAGKNNTIDSLTRKTESQRRTIITYKGLLTREKAIKSLYKDCKYEK